LQKQFGNLGLAAAAYNAGPQRVRDWLSGKRTLPRETRNYVLKVTGYAAEQWAGPQAVTLVTMPPAKTTCGQMAQGAVKPPAPVKIAAVPAAATPSSSSWGVQLIGDRSEANARLAYMRMKMKHQAILGGYEPVVLRTTVKTTGLVVWNRLRIDAATRQIADLLCSKLRSVGENCLVQHN